MKNTINRALVFFLSIVSFSLYSQDTLQGCLFLDFENIEGMNLFEGAEISNQFEASFGLTFSLEGGGFPVLAEVGGSFPAAFGSAFGNGNDTPDPQDAALIGQFFLTDDGVLAGLESPPVILDFATAIDSFAGCILDMDFGEIFRIEAYGEFGDLILEDSIMAGDPNTGDGRATCWGFNLGNCTGMVYQLKFSGERETAGAFGLGLDNFSFCYAGVNAAVEYVICEGDSLVINDEIYTDAGSYEQLLFTDEGCDSLVFIDLEVLPSFEASEEYSFCEGESIEINGIVYDMGGSYQQNYTTAGGCDSILNIEIEEIDAFNTVESYGICDGDSLIINGEIYLETNTYTQQFESSQGCDSVLTIHLEVYETYLENIDLSICEGESIIYNGEEYDTAGEYEQVFTTIEDCDSTIVISLEVNPTYLLTEEYEICDNETIEINGVIYDSSGSFQQDYLTNLGCDSTLIIELDVLPTFESMESYTIVDGESIEINGETFNISGDYVQILTANNGCDSLVNIEIIVLPPPDPETILYYDLNNCSAAAGYNEFTPSYPMEIECTTVNASIISRPSGFGHSCTPGLNGSQAMCISSQVSCEYDENSDNRISFDFMIQPESGTATVISHFNFYEKAPELFEWTTGGTGDNNYPTLYGIRILKNNVEIFRDDAISTNRDWTLQSFDFTSNDDFRISTASVIRVEMIPYCTIGNFSTVTAWDIDDLSIQAYCSAASSRLFGTVKSSSTNKSMESVQLQLRDNGPSSTIYTDEKGWYAFDNLIAPYQYEVSAYYNQDVKNGISTLDLILIQKHILDIQAFDREEQFIAADINQSNSISAIDLIELRKLILGINHEFLNNTSWRFFENAQTPLSPWQWNESIHVDENNYNNIDFKGIKIGDVNNSHNINVEVENRSVSETILGYHIEERDHLSIIHFNLSERIDLHGMQMALDLENNLVDVIPGILSLTKANVHYSDNQLNISYSENQHTAKANDILFSIVVSNEVYDLDLAGAFNNEIYIGTNLAIHEISLEPLEGENVFHEALSNLSVAPNPFSNETQISFDHHKEEPVVLQIFDINGRSIFRKTMDAQNGVNALKLNRNEHQLDSGYYILQLSTESQVISIKLLCI